MMEYMILGNAILIALLSCYMAWLVVCGVDAGRVRTLVEDTYRSGIGHISDKYNERRLHREAKKHTRTVSIDMSWPERMELHLVDKSNIRRYLPFMNIYMVMLSSAFIFAGCFGPVYRMVRFIPSSAVLCLILSTLPFMLLDLMAKHNSEMVRRKLAYYVSVLLRWCAVKEDIFYGFEKSVDSGIGEPLRSYTRDLVIQVRRGMDPVKALDILQLKVDNEQFKDFVLNIKQCVKHRGDILKLLGCMEAQFYQIESEYNRRKISTYQDRMTIVLAMLGVVAIAAVFFRSPAVYAYYFDTTQGKWLLTLFAGLYAAGFYIFTKITDFKH